MINQFVSQFSVIFNLYTDLKKTRQFTDTHTQYQDEILTKKNYCTNDNIFDSYTFFVFLFLVFFMNFFRT